MSLKTWNRVNMMEAVTVRREQHLHSNLLTLRFFSPIFFASALIFRFSFSQNVKVKSSCHSFAYI